MVSLLSSVSSPIGAVLQLLALGTLAFFAAALWLPLAALGKARDLLQRRKPRVYSSILVTGASSGIGEGLALRYARAGVHLALSGRNEERLESVARECRKRGAVVSTKVLDVTDREACAAWIAEVDRQHPLDLVIANAGTAEHMLSKGTPEEKARQIFDVNVTGVMNTIYPALRRFEDRRSGHIAIVSSLTAFVPLPTGPAYSASKAAVQMLGECLRQQYRGVVDISVVAPGFVASRMVRALDDHMPLEVSAAHSADIIADGLSRNEGLVAYPSLLHTVAWAIGALPHAVRDMLSRVLHSRLTKFSNLREKRA